RENIQRIVDEFGHLFDMIVVSTWDNEVKGGDGWPGVKLISVPDPGGIKQLGHYKDNNKHRQFISTLNGVLELEKSGIEYAVKTRTDTYLDFKELVESFFADVEERKNSNAICATAVHGPNYLLHDLYFAATTKALKEFCEAIESFDKFEFISSVHREMVLKHAYAHYREIIDVPDWAYFPKFPPDGASAETRKIFDYMFRNVFFAFNPEIFRSTLWRGEHFPPEHVDSLVEVKQKYRKYNIPGFISTDWRRYHHFLLQTSGRKIILPDKAKAMLGKLGWSLWNLVRKLWRMIR
ncbi:MAG: WavE lipopolysaccharide synthesis family protein, partial [Patescibacteria group bacterium]|nr:WavE lipopolysaccharide synthesis family protein [Patescibacteria group bacterium]